MIVIVLVDVTDRSLDRSPGGPGGASSSVAAVVSSEVVSDLESVPYIKFVIVSPL
jgi:hypothetical protein